MLEIKLFGTLSVHYNNQPVTRFPGKRVKDLLSYLLLRRESLHAREQIAGMLWSEMDDRKARHCLNTALWRLNQVLAHADHRTHPALRVDAERIGFNTACEFRLDVAEFESYFALAKGLTKDDADRQASLYHKAVALYTADLLVDCYEDWCIIERERLSRMYVRSLDQLVAYHSGRGEHEIAIDFALRLLACDPLREEVHRDLIRLYLTSNQTSAALQQYRSCEGIIRRELGMDPMAETRALLPQIVAIYDAPAGIEAPNIIEQPDAIAQRLEGILTSLHEAAATFQAAYAQLLVATQRVQEVVGEVEHGPAPMPLPSNRRLEDQFLSGKGRIVEAIQRLQDVRETA